MDNQEQMPPIDPPPGKLKFDWLMRYASSIKSEFQQRRANRNQETPQDRAARHTANATWVIAFFTAVTILVGYAQWNALRSTDEATHAAAEAAKQAAEVASRTLIASQRAWIRTEVAVGSQPLIFSEGKRYRSFGCDLV